MKVSVTQLANGGAVIIVSGAGTENIIAEAKRRGILPGDLVLEAIEQHVKEVEKNEPNRRHIRHKEVPTPGQDPAGN